jgi:hypothetical protein
LYTINITPTWKTRLFKRKDQNNHSPENVDATFIMGGLVTTEPDRGSFLGECHHPRLRYPMLHLLTCAEPFLEKLEHILITQKPSVVCPDADSFFRRKTISLSTKYSSKDHK